MCSVNKFSNFLLNDRLAVSRCGCVHENSSSSSLTHKLMDDWELGDYTASFSSTLPNATTEQANKPLKISLHLNKYPIFFYSKH